MKQVTLTTVLKWILMLAGAAPLSSALARDGGMGSGGGELLADGINPWFLDYPGVPDVTYRIARSGDFSVTDPAVLEALVKSAFDCWDREFASGYLPDNYSSDAIG